MGWKKLDNKIEIDDIGGRLLENLAKGIYTDAAVVREYVQNSADAYEELYREYPELTQEPKITVQVDLGEKSISIHDSAIGMDHARIRDAKKIAVSSKTNANLTGFRGIGIWAGFQACEKLEIISTRIGEPHRYRLVIEFGKILEHTGDGLNIKQLLDDRFRIEEDKEDSQNHYTQVTLIGLKGDYHKLLDEAYLRKIVAHNLPCRIDPKHKYAKDIAAWIGGGEGYQECHIVVGAEEVYKDFPEDVSPPQFGTLKHGKDEVARVWWCAGQGALKVDGLEYRGFKLRVRNFAVGGTNAYDEEDGSLYQDTTSLKTRVRLNWFCGEIHVTHPEIVPDTPRSKLEHDYLSIELIKRIREFYGDRIADAGARADFNTYTALLKETRQSIDNNSLTSEMGAAALKKLEDMERMTRGPVPDAKLKRFLREYLKEPQTKALRKALIKELKEKFSAPLEDDKPTGNSGDEKGAGKKKGKSGSAAPQTENGTSGTGTQEPQDKLQLEALASEIMALVSEKISDDEIATEIAEALQSLFIKFGLLIPA